MRHSVVPAGYAPYPRISAAASSRNDLHVMSVNVRRPIFTDGPNYWPFRKDNLTATLRHVSPDIIATQEGVASQIRDLQKDLPRYQHVGVGRSNGKAAGETCTLFFKSRRFDLLASGHFWLSNSPHKAGSRAWGEPFPRMVTWVKLRDRHVGRTLHVFNSHFSVFSKKARINSAHLLEARIKQIAGTGPVIVAGDFNAKEGSATHTRLTRRPWTDTYRVIHPQRNRHEGTRHHFRGKTTGHRIDWIVVSSQFKTRDAEILRQSVTGRPVSDHYPVTATLHWTASPTFAQHPSPQRNVQMP